MEELNLQMFSWMDIDIFEMQLLEFQSSSVWKQKFIDLRVELEKIGRRRWEEEHELLRVWNAIPEHIFMLKKLCNSLTLHALFYICLWIIVFSYEFDQVS